MKKIENDKTEEKLAAGSAEWYKGKIIEIVKQLENIGYLKFIYSMMIAFKSKWGI